MNSRVIKIVKAIAWGGLWLGSVGPGCAPAFFRENTRTARVYLKNNPSSEGTFSLQSPTNGKRSIHFVTGGSPGKTKVIFVHGSPGSWISFASYLDDPELKSRSFLLSVDRPGYGQSGGGVPETSISRQAEFLLPLLNLDDPRQSVVLVGHSYGAPVAARMAMGADPRIRNLVILAGSVDPDLERKKWFQYPADWSLVRWLMPADLDVCNQEIEALKSELVAMKPRWRDIQAKISVVQGLEDDLVPPGNADYVEREATFAKPKIVRVPGLDHFIPWKRADLVRAQILDALKEIEGNR